MKRFPSGVYGRQRLQFFPAPFRPPLRAFAALVFAWQEDRVAVCDIVGRGWCVPSGRVEPDESSAEAVLREAVEEGGIVLDAVQYIGSYQISERREVRWADCYVGHVSNLVEIGMAEESNGRQFMTLEDLPALYHNWSPLTEMVFQHSREVLRRLDQRKAV